MAFGFDDILGIGLGLLGLDQQNDEANRRNSLEERGMAVQEAVANPQIEALKRLLSLAQGFDPMAEGRAGVEQAGRETQQNIQAALRGLNTDFLTGGGTPGQSSAFNVRAQKMTDDAADPLRAYLARAYSNPTEQRMNMFMRVLGSAPGDLAGNYFKMAGQHQPDYSGAMGLLGQGLGNLVGGGDHDIFKNWRRNSKPSEPNIYPGG